MDFFAVKINGSDVKPEICVIVKTRSYRHTENISLDSEPNRYYFMKINRNSQIHCSFVTFQLDGLWPLKCLYLMFGGFYIFVIFGYS